MLERILKQLQQGGTTNVKVLAQQLDVSEGLVEQMLAELVQLGYLQRVETCHQKACGSCPQSSSCATRHPNHIWVFEDQKN